MNNLAASSEVSNIRLLFRRKRRGMDPYKKIQGIELISELNTIPGERIPYGNPGKMKHFGMIIEESCKEFRSDCADLKHDPPASASITGRHPRFERDTNANPMDFFNGADAVRRRR